MLSCQGQCGSGGIGRRAALRSLWGNTRGSSSLLGRTNINQLEQSSFIRHIKAGLLYNPQFILMDWWSFLLIVCGQKGLCKAVDTIQAILLYRQVYNCPDSGENT